MPTNGEQRFRKRTVYQIRADLITRTGLNIKPEQDAVEALSHEFAMLKRASDNSGEWVAARDSCSPDSGDYQKLIASFLELACANGQNSEELRSQIITYFTRITNNTPKNPEDRDYSWNAGQFFYSSGNWRDYRDASYLCYARFEKEMEAMCAYVAEGYKESALPKSAPKVAYAEKFLGIVRNVKKAMEDTGGISEAALDEAKGVQAAVIPELLATCPNAADARTRLEAAASTPPPPTRTAAEAPAKSAEPKPTAPAHRPWEKRKQKEPPAKKQTDRPAVPPAVEAAAPKEPPTPITPSAPLTEPVAANTSQSAPNLPELQPTDPQLAPTRPSATQAEPTGPEQPAIAPVIMATVAAATAIATAEPPPEATVAALPRPPIATRPAVAALQRTLRTIGGQRRKTPVTVEPILVSPTSDSVPAARFVNLITAPTTAQTTPESAAAKEAINNLVALLESPTTTPINPAGDPSEDPRITLESLVRRSLRAAAPAMTEEHLTGFSSIILSTTKVIREGLQAADTNTPEGIGQARTLCELLTQQLEPLVSVLGNTMSDDDIKHLESLLNHQEDVTEQLESALTSLPQTQKTVERN